MKTLQIKFLGKDSHCRDVYGTEYGAILKNIESDGLPTQENLATSLNNRFDGEPDMPLTYKKQTRLHGSIRQSIALCIIDNLQLI